SDTALFSHVQIKVLTPEQLFDSLVAVTGAPGRGDIGPRNKAANARPGPAGPRAAVVAFFTVEENADPTEYQAGIPQALRLMNSAQFANSPLVNQATRSGLSPEKGIERLFLATLSRRPSKAELDKFTAHVQKNDGKTAYSDILWALL